MRAAAAVLAFVLAVPAAAQIKGPDEISVPVGRLAPVVLTLDADDAKYALLGGDVFGGFREFSDPKEFRFQVLGYGPGVGYIVVSAVKGGKLLEPFVVRVRVGANPGPGPGPQPPPDPPPPDPKPPTGVVKYLVVIEETADAASNRGAFFTDAALGARMKERGIRARVVDKDVVDDKGQPPADVRRFIEKARGQPLARVFLLDDKGRELFAGNMPEDPARLLELLGRFGG